jgi:hypothetical protein
MRFLLTLILTIICGLAFAGETHRFPLGVVSVGDPVAALVELAGQPSHKADIENLYGAVIGERWDYYLPEGNMVQFNIHEGRISNIVESRR